MKERKKEERKEEYKIGLGERSEEGETVYVY